MTLLESERKEWEIINILSINMSTEENAMIFLNAFKPEIKTIPMKRSHLQISKENNNIIIKIKALDINALRASINSTLQFANVVNTTINYVRDSEKQNSN